MLELRNILNKKLNKKGFTLAELLVVVAIIAILVAVSIPIFTSKLNEAKKNTDLANVRAAKAAAVNEYLTEEKTDEVTYYYDADKGTVAENGTNIKPYNQADAEEGAAGTDNRDGKESCIVEVTIGADGADVTTAWVVPAAGGTR